MKTIVSKNFMDDLSDSSSEDSEPVVKVSKKKVTPVVQSTQKSLLEQDSEEPQQKKEKKEKKQKKETQAIEANEVNEEPVKKVKLEQEPKKFTPVQKPQQNYQQNYQQNSNQNEQRPRQENAEFEVLVRNIPKDADEDRIHDFFSDYVQVASINLLKNRSSGASLGIAFIRLHDSTNVKKAVALNHLDFGSSQITVEECRKKTTVFIKNLSFSTTEYSLQNVLSKYKGFMACRVAKDEFGKNKGFGHADFDCFEAAKNIRNQKNISVDGRIIVIEQSKTAKPQANDFSAPQQNNHDSGIRGQNNQQSVKSNQMRGTRQGGVPLKVDRDELAYKTGAIQSFQGSVKKL